MGWHHDDLTWAQQADAGGGTTLAEAARLITDSLAGGGTLFLAGNGGSFADALHIAGELAKSFERPRPLPEPLRARLCALPGGEELAANLQKGLPTIVLGNNGALTSAVDNDLALRHVTLAQELVGLVRAGDVLLAISTSGSSRNLLNAALVARATGATVVALTGPSDSPLGALADVVVRGPGTSTADIQGAHVGLYHRLCRLIEDALFAG